MAPLAEPAAAVPCSAPAAAVYDDLVGPRRAPPDPDTDPPTLAYPPADEPRTGGSPWASPPGAGATDATVRGIADGRLADS